MRIAWDAIGEHFYKAGVDRGVLYRISGDEFIDGVPWNGLTSYEPKVSGRDKAPLYSNDTIKKNIFTAEEYGGTITAVTYPEELEPCLGNIMPFPGVYVGQQEREMFGFSYRTQLGDDAQGTDRGYRITLVYNAHVTEISESSKTNGDNNEVSELSISFETIPLEVSDEYDLDPFSTIIIDSTEFNPESLESLEDILYGTENTSPRMPTFDEIMALYMDYYVQDTSIWDGYPYPTLYGREAMLYPKTP